MDKVIVSLTTISTRIEKLHLTLSSLLEQDYPNFEVRVFISRKPFLIDGGIQSLPPECHRLIRADPRLRLFYVPNIGPYRKLLPILTEASGTAALVATADDDTIYPANWLSLLCHYYRRFRCIIGFRGHQMFLENESWLNYRKWMTKGVQSNPSPLCLPTGKDGVLYNTSFFHPGVLDVQKALSYAATTDDLWFKWHTAILQVPVYLINTNFRSSSLENTNSGTSLYEQFNEKGGNDSAIDLLEKYAAKEMGTTLSEAMLNSGVVRAP